MSFFDLSQLTVRCTSDAVQSITRAMADEIGPVPKIVSAMSAAPATLLQSGSSVAGVADVLRSDAEDQGLWCELYEERAAIREFDGGLARREAERRALEDVVQHWLAKHPLPASGRVHGCVHCRGAEPDTPLLAHDGHAWLHQACWSSLMARRAAEARGALIRLLNLPQDFDVRQDSSTIPGGAGEIM